MILALIFDDFDVFQGYIIEKYIFFWRGEHPRQDILGRKTILIR